MLVHLKPFSIVIVLTVLERLCVLLYDEAAACDCTAADAAPDTADYPA